MVRLDPGSPEDRMVIELLLENEQFKQKLKESDIEIQKTGKSIEKTASNIEKMMALQSVTQGISGVGQSLASLGVNLKSLAEDYATNLAVQKSFNRNMEEMGKNAGEVIEQIEKVTKGGLARSQIRELVNLGMALDIPIDAYEDLMAISKKAARDLGEDVNYMADSIIRGLGRESPLILDNLGIKLRSMQEILHDYVIEMGLAHAEDAKQLKEAVKGLDAKQRKLALVREIQKKYAKDIQEEKSRSKDLKDVMENLAATMENLADSGFGKLTRAAGNLGVTTVQVAAGVAQIAVALKVFDKNIGGVLSKITGVRGLIAGTRALGAAFTGMGAAASAAIAVIAAEAAALLVILGNIGHELYKLNRAAKETARLKAETAAVVQETVDKTGRGRVLTTTEYNRSFWSGKRGTVTATSTRYTPAAAPVEVNVNQMGGANIRNQQRRSMRGS